MVGLIVKTFVIVNVLCFGIGPCPFTYFLEVIILLILITFLLDYILMLFGEN